MTDADGADYPYDIEVPEWHASYDDVPDDAGTRRWLRYQDRRNGMSRREILERRAERVLCRLAELEARPDEPVSNDEDGANVVWFKKQFTPTSIAYTYAAVQARGNWYLSGAKNVCQGVSWDVLCDFIYAEHEAGRALKPELWQATAWEQVD